MIHSRPLPPPPSFPLPIIVFLTASWWRLTSRSAGAKAAPRLFALRALPALPPPCCL